jgi:hypothetical protein
VGGRKEVVAVVALEATTRSNGEDEEYEKKGRSVVAKRRGVRSKE